MRLAHVQAPEVITYRLPKRRHYGMFNPRPLRIIPLLVLVPLILALATSFTPLLGVLLLLPLWLSFVPTDAGFGIDKLISDFSTWKLRRRGGYTYTPDSVNVDGGKSASGVRTVEYYLPYLDKALTVARNVPLRSETAYIQIDAWPGSASSDSPVRRRQDNDLHRIMVEITSRLVDHVVMEVLTRDPDVSEALEHYRDNADHGQLKDSLDAVELVTEKAREVTYLFKVRCGIPDKPYKLLREEGRWQEIPIVKVVAEVLGYLEGIGMQVKLLSGHEFARMTRLEFDPIDAAQTYDYATTDSRVLRERGDNEDGHGTTLLSLQRPAIPNSSTSGGNFLRVHGSYHAVLATSQFGLEEVPPGFFDAALMGLAPNCVTSLRLDVKDKSKAKALANISRSWSIGKTRDLEEQGHVFKERELKEEEERRSRYDEIDMAIGELAYWSLMYMISAETPEALDYYCSQAISFAKRCALTVERIDGAEVQLRTVHAVLGLA